MRLSEVSSPKQYSRNRTPPVSYVWVEGTFGKFHAQYDWTTGVPDNGKWMEEVPRRTSLAPLASPCFLLCLGVEAERLLDYQGRAGIISIVQWNLRPVIFGVEKCRIMAILKGEELHALLGLFSGMVDVKKKEVVGPASPLAKGNFQAQALNNCKASVATSNPRKQNALQLSTTKFSK